jgi:hypothetical protein
VDLAAFLFIDFSLGMQQNLRELYFIDALAITLILLTPPSGAK